MNAFALLMSRFTVAGARSTTPAISSIVRPP